MVIRGIGIKGTEMTIPKGMEDLPTKGSISYNKMTNSNTNTI